MVSVKAVDAYVVVTFDQPLSKEWRYTLNYDQNVDGTLKKEKELHFKVRNHSYAKKWVNGTVFLELHGIDMKVAALTGDEKVYSVEAVYHLSDAVLPVGPDRVGYSIYQDEVCNVLTWTPQSLMYSRRYAMENGESWIVAKVDYETLDTQTQVFYNPEYSLPTKEEQEAATQSALDMI